MKRLYIALLIFGQPFGQACIIASDVTLSFQPAPSLTVKEAPNAKAPTHAPTQKPPAIQPDSQRFTPEKQSPPDSHAWWNQTIDSMPCFYPLKAWRSLTRNPSGKRSIVFQPEKGFDLLPVTLPCGTCEGCRLEYSRQWAMRCMHEASLHDDNTFVTLTYNDSALPDNNSLSKRHIQLFLKKLRKHAKFRYFVSGEYGEHTNRPHYHGLLFGLAFNDRIPLSTRGDHVVSRSPTLEKLWTQGTSELGSVTFDSAAYVARYATKKPRDTCPEQLRKHYRGRTPEFALMSRKPGIGKQWWDNYKEEVMHNDSVIIGGREVKPSRYYDAQFEKTAEGNYKNCKQQRKATAKKRQRTEQQLDAAREILLARQQLFKRQGL